MNWSAATHIGSRDYQEDRFIVIERTRCLLAAVFDGHGGDEAAELCRRHLPDALDRTRGIASPHGILEAIFNDLNSRTSWMASGTTASMVLIQEPPLAHVAILGDSPVIIDTPKGLWIAPEHNVRTNNDEMEAAITRGGVDGQDGYLYEPTRRYGLQISRALGDHRMGDVISKTPDIGFLPMDKWVLLASDGLVDPSHVGMSNIQKIALRLGMGSNAQDLVDIAVSKRAKDNVTAIVIRP